MVLPLTALSTEQEKKLIETSITLCIKHSIGPVPFLRCLDEEQAHFSCCQCPTGHAGASFEDGNTYHQCFLKWYGDRYNITREMCSGAHISRENTYHWLST